MIFACVYDLSCVLLCCWQILWHYSDASSSIPVGGTGTYVMLHDVLHCVRVSRLPQSVALRRSGHSVLTFLLSCLQQHVLPCLQSGLFLRPC
jgi:hypothetical protein